jgi:hypothetical protein
MADNIDITPGTGKTILTDDCTTGHAQIIKLAIATDGSATLIPADGTDGLLVNLGANNDVAATLAAETTKVIGTVNVAAAQTIGLAAGTAYAGKVRITDGTNDLSIDTSETDGESNTKNRLPVESTGHYFNGSTWDRTQTAVAINNTSSDGGTALTSSYAQIKTSAGTLAGYYIYNPNATAVYVQFWNALTANVTIGTTTPYFMLTIPPTSAANLWMAPGVRFSTAMGWSATSTAGGTGAPTTALDAVCWYV